MAGRMSAGPKPTAPGQADTHPLPTTLVKATALATLPWTIGSLLSPFGEPHMALLALPLAALGAIIAAVRLNVRVRRPWPAWLFCALLCSASAARFIAMPILGEIWTGGDDLDEVGARLSRLIWASAGIRAVFYIGAGALLLHSSIVVPLALLHERKRSRAASSP